MPKSPLTREEFREELRDQLNDRFEHYEKRAANSMIEHERHEDERHREMMQGFAQVIENVNDHTTAEFAKLRQELEIRKEFDRLAANVAKRFGVSVSELTGR